MSKNVREIIAKRAAQEIQDGFYVNLRNRDADDGGELYSEDKNLVFSRKMAY